MKRALSWKATLSIYLNISVLTLTYGHRLWVVNKRRKLLIQETARSHLLLELLSGSDKTALLQPNGFVEVQKFMVVPTVHDFMNL